MVHSFHLAEKVLPNLRDVHDEWEDRWWIKPLPSARRAPVGAK